MNEKKTLSIGWLIGAVVAVTVLFNGIALSLI
jgi:hypothetical protein